MLIVISDPYMQETDLTQFHQLDIQTILLLCFCLYERKEIECQKKVKRDRNISSKLVHIENVIGLAKSYTIIILALNRTKANLASNISFVITNYA
jgi:hypothetical protein